MKKDFQSRYLLKDYKIPNFVKQSPEYYRLFQKEIEIVTDGKKWGLKIEGFEREVDYDFDTFFEAYYDTYRFNRATHTVYFTDDIGNQIFGKPEKYGEDDDDNSNSNIGNMFYGRKVKNGHAIISSHRGDYWVKNLESDYENWQALDGQLTEESFKGENIIQIFRWLNEHPDFWKQEILNDHVYWSTENGVSTLWAAPILEAGKAVWFVEGGEHVLSDEDVAYASTFYHDIELDGAGSTYDEALVNFARNVWKKSRENG